MKRSKLLRVLKWFATGVAIVACMCIYMKEHNFAAAAWALVSAIMLLASALE